MHLSSKDHLFTFPGLNLRNNPAGANESETLQALTSGHRTAETASEAPSPSHPSSTRIINACRLPLQNPSRFSLRPSHALFSGPVRRTYVQVPRITRGLNPPQLFNQRPSPVTIILLPSPCSSPVPLPSPVVHCPALVSRRYFSPPCTVNHETERRPSFRR